MVTRNRFGRPTRPSPNGRSHAPRPAKPEQDTSWATLHRAWTSFGRRVPKMRADLSSYAGVQTDRLRMHVAEAFVRLMAGTVLVLTLAAVCAVAVTMVMLGVAGWFTTLLDGNRWFAFGLTGVATLAALVVVVVVGLYARRRGRLSRLRARYRREPTAPAPSTHATGTANDQ